MSHFLTHDCYTTRDADRPNAICDSNGEVVLSLCKRCGRGEAELWDDPCPAPVKVSETRSTLQNGTVVIQRTFVPPQIAEEDAPGLYLDSGEFVPAQELNGLLQDEPGQGARQLSKALSEKPDARLRAREALAESLSEEIVGWEHLKAYGYAPGNYMSRCRRCDATPVMDKRATTCRPCAEKLHNAALARMNQQDVVLSITTAYEQGFGHALRTELSNPYSEGSCEFDAWAMGREVGARRATLSAELTHAVRICPEKDTECGMHLCAKCPKRVKGGVPAKFESNWTRDGIATFIADNWPDRKHTLAEIEAGIRAIEIRPPGQERWLKLSDDYRLCLEQAPELLEDYAAQLKTRGHDSISEGAKASAYVLRQLLSIKKEPQ